jgi:hypothetical protein
MSPPTHVYVCQCSRCHGKAKSLTKRTIEAHLAYDQHYIQSLPSNADLTTSRAYVESCINQTIQLLSKHLEDRILLDTAPDAEGSGLEGSEGASLHFSGSYHILTLLLLFI